MEGKLQLGGKKKRKRDGSLRNDTTMLKERYKGCKCKHRELRIPFKLIQHTWANCDNAALHASLWKLNSALTSAKKWGLHPTFHPSCSGSDHCLGTDWYRFYSFLDSLFYSIPCNILHDVRQWLIAFIMKAVTNPLHRRENGDSNSSKATQFANTRTSRQAWMSSSLTQRLFFHPVLRYC